MVMCFYDKKLFDREKKDICKSIVLCNSDFLPELLSGGFLKPKKYKYSYVTVVLVDKEN